MIAVVVVLAVLTLAAVSSWLVWLRSSRDPTWRRAVIVASLVVVDGWLWTFAVAHAFGPQRWLIVPLALANGTAGLGLVQSTTGLRVSGRGRGGADLRGRRIGGERQHYD